MRNGVICGAALRRTSVGAGRQAGDRLARADEPRTTGRCGGPLRADSWTDPRRGGSGDPHNAIIQDLGLAPRNARGKVEYVATFALAKPVDLAKASRVLLYQVVNRGSGQATANAEGDITLVSGWQGDAIPTAMNQTITVPVARNKDGSPLTGRVIARLFDLPDGAYSVPIRLATLGTPQPYRPADLAQTGATLTWHTREKYAGQQDAKHTVPRVDWAFADCEIHRGRADRMLFINASGSESFAKGKRQNYMTDEHIAGSSRRIRRGQRVPSNGIPAASI